MTTDELKRKLYIRLVFDTEPDELSDNELEIVNVLWKDPAIYTKLNLNL